MAKYSNPFRALRNRNYLLFWLPQSVSLIGTWIDTTLRGWVAVNLFSENEAAGFIGLVAFLKGLPTVILSPVCGVMIDWFGPKNVLLFTQIADALNATLMAYLVHKGVLSALQLLFLSLVMGISQAFYLPSRNTFIGTIVPRSLLSNALALHAMIFNFARMIGPSIAGFIVEYKGMSFGFLINAITFLPLIVSLFFIKGEKANVQQPERNFFTDMRAGVVYIASHKVLLVTFLSSTIYAVFGMPYSMLMQAFAKSAVKTGLVGYGLIMGSMGLGALVGAMLAGSLEVDTVVKFREEYLILWIGLSTLVSFMYPPAAFVMSFVNGASQTIFFNTANTRTQYLSPANMKGRTMSLYALINNGGSPVGTFLFGLLGNKIGIRNTYGVLASAMIAYFLARKSIKALQIDLEDLPQIR
ncbi:MAG: MFS transporter [Pseudothermotoga sp.]|nr:MFS transporter [Pseudothermotoga sp.]MDW8140198.1 MFS transporter [Pseudothermotoga sp.]